MADRQLEDRYKTSCPELYSTNHLIWLGMRNSAWNQFAREILASRGEAYQVLYDHARIFKDYKGVRRIGRPSFDDIDPKSWLAPDPVEYCVDCKKLTSRQFNGYFQCETCAAEITAAGSRENWRDAKLIDLLKRRAAAEEKRQKKQEQKQAQHPAEIIGAHEPSYEELVKDGVDPEVLKAVGNREAIQAAQDAYNEHKTNSALAQAIQGVKHHAA